MTKARGIFKWRPPLSSEAPLCACGCGQKVGRKGGNERAWNKFVKGHQFLRKGVRFDRRDRRMEAYGITVGTYEAMLRGQGGVCAICGTDDPKGPLKTKHFCVDHDHNTGAVRGLLCGPCNKALGLFNDDPKRLAKAIAYVRDGGMFQ